MGDQTGGPGRVGSLDAPGQVDTDAPSRHRLRTRVLIVGMVLVVALGADLFWSHRNPTLSWRCASFAMDHQGPVAATPEDAFAADLYSDAPGSVDEYERREIDGSLQLWRRRGSSATMIWLSPVGTGWATSSFAFHCSSVDGATPGTFRR